MEINVYTDGACSRNGQKGANAGLGVYFGENDPRNCSEKITGKQTNNTAELKAIIRAIELLERDIAVGTTINIYTDSDYARRCCTTYGEKLEANNWKKKKPIHNVELVKKAYYLSRGKSNINFHYIAAHTGRQDAHSLGNEGADRLANLAIGQTECEYANRPKKIYLKLPYAEKDKGKKLGTKWDPKKKKWYILSTIDENTKETILNLWG